MQAVAEADPAEEDRSLDDVRAALRRQIQNDAEWLRYARAAVVVQVAPQFAPWPVDYAPIVIRRLKGHRPLERGVIGGEDEPPWVVAAQRAAALAADLLNAVRLLAGEQA